MEIGFVKEIFFVLLAGLVGGVFAKLVRLQPIIGYLLAGVFFSFIFPKQSANITQIAQIGAVLLLFSVGIELSLERLKRVLKIAILGGIVQIVLTSIVLSLFLVAFRFSFVQALILALGFSLSSTAVVVKILTDRGEIETVHGELMLGWLLVQDLAIIPIMVLMPSFIFQSSGFVLGLSLAFLKAVGVIAIVVTLGKLIVPYLVHKVVSLNSRELLLILAVALALGTAIVTSLLGVTAALGAFLAGVVISETQENHAVFAETRPLRDLFVALFFITLGFWVKPAIFTKHFFLILGLVGLVFLVKFVIFLGINYLFSYRGRVAVLSSLGLTQIGEFSFILIVQAVSLKLINDEIASIAVATALLSLLFTPLVFKYSYSIFNLLKTVFSKQPFLRKFITLGQSDRFKESVKLKKHIIICGYGRMGKWVGRALDLVEIPYLVIDYNQNALNQAKKRGINCLFGDASDKEVISKANLKEAEAVVVAIPDRISQEELITFIQTVSPKIKIFSRAHFTEDLERLRFLRVDGVVQPEFEAAIALVRLILAAYGKSREEIKLKIKGLRQSYAMTK